MNLENKSIIERRKSEFNTGDKKEEMIKIISGEWYVSSKENQVIATILGSCVAACIRDSYAKVGGMNHFLLPGEDSSDSKISESARYGLFAMESLINGIIKMGGRKDRFEIKVFGGGNVINNSAMIGSKNAKFVLEFLQKEGLRVISQDLEGNFPRKVLYYPTTGKVMVRRLQRREDMEIVKQEEAFKKTITSKPIESDIELF